MISQLTNYTILILSARKGFVNIISQDSLPKEHDSKTLANFVLKIFWRKEAAVDYERF